MDREPARKISELATDTRLDSGGWTESAEMHVPGLTILWHPQTRRIGERAPLAALGSGRSVELSRLTPDFVHPGGGPREPLGESRLSRSPIRLVPCPEGIRVEAGASRTAVEVDGEKLEESLLVEEGRLRRGAVLLLGERIVLLLHRLDPIVPDLPSYGLVGESPGLLGVRQAIRQVGDLDVTVLLRGGTGTGKELVARALHRASPRRDGPFVAVNMAAVPASLAAAELFGAAKGAFTGADSKRSGYFQRAQSGTLFLDEVGETPPEIQALLLRALETHEIQPVGAEQPTRVDVRVVSATDLDLEGAVESERFRGPLLYRLSGFVLRLPTLGERMEDFGRLFVHFLRRELEALGEADRLEPPCSWLPASLCAQLALYDWPGNVRQLANTARQLVIANRGFEKVRRLEPIQAMLHRTVAEAASPASAAEATGGDATAATPPRRPSDVREEELVDALRRNRFRLQQTADELGINRASLYDLIDKSSKIRKASEIDAAEIEATLEAGGGSVEKAAEALEVSEQALRRRMGRLGLSS